MFSQKWMLVFLALCAYMCITLVIFHGYNVSNDNSLRGYRKQFGNLNTKWKGSDHYKPTDLRRYNYYKNKLKNYSRADSGIDARLDEGKVSNFMVTIPERRYRPLSPSCKKLIYENSPYFQKTSRILSFKYPYVNSKNYTSDTTNCSKFLHQRGYILGVTDEEAEFPVAFSILMYKDVEQVERLLRAIYRPSNYYCVHVDRNAISDVQRQMRSIVNCFPNVFFASKQIAVRWGQYSVLKPDLICMQDLLEKPRWKYFINLTGQEFPLKTNLQLVRILKILNGTNNVDADTRPYVEGRWRHALPSPHNIQPTKGCVHVVISRKFVEYAIDDSKVRDFAYWLKNTYIPDELFFSTLDNDPNLHAPGSSNGCQGKPTDYIHKPFIARFKVMESARGERSFMWPCHGTRVRGVCVFGAGDLPLITSRRELFVNKIHIGYHQTFECLEEWHRNRTLDEYKGLYTFDYEFYRNMTQVKCTAALFSKTY